MSTPRVAPRAAPPACPCRSHIGPSLLACDLAQLGAEAARMLAAGLNGWLWNIQHVLKPFSDNPLNQPHISSACVQGNDSRHICDCNQSRVETKTANDEHHMTG